MNVAELERFVSRADNDELDYYDGCDPYWAANLARRVIAAEKLVERINDKAIMNAGEFARYIRDEVAAYEATK